MEIAFLQAVQNMLVVALALPALVLVIGGSGLAVLAYATLRSM